MVFLDAKLIVALVGMVLPSFASTRDGALVPQTRDAAIEAHGAQPLAPRTPMDPIIEEPIRPLFSPQQSLLEPTGSRRCGVWSPIMLVTPLLVLTLSRWGCPGGPGRKPNRSTYRLRDPC